MKLYFIFPDQLLHDGLRNKTLMHRYSRLASLTTNEVSGGLTGKVNVWRGELNFFIWLKTWMATLGVQLAWLPWRWHCIDCSSGGSCDIGIRNEDDVDGDVGDGDDEGGDDDVDGDDDEEDFATSRWHIEHNCSSTLVISQLWASFFRTTLLKTVTMANHGRNWGSQQWWQR